MTKLSSSTYLFLFKCLSVASVIIFLIYYFSTLQIGHHIVQRFNSEEQPDHPVIYIFNYSFENKAPQPYLPPCPVESPYLRGKSPINKTLPTFEDLTSQFTWLQPGGRGQPENCTAAEKVAIIVPFRNREQNLLILLQHLHPFLRRQQRDYAFFVIEQNGTDPFNRGILMNIGFIEALKVDAFDCFVFHDVDLLPENDKNLYGCGIVPKHLSVSMDKFKYSLPYADYFGGVTAMKREVYITINGFSNSYWGWGAEDDDLFNRVTYHKLPISRYYGEATRYTMLKHGPSPPNPKRYNLLRQGKQKYSRDGLSSLEYNVSNCETNLLYTRILVNFQRKS